MNNFNYVNAMKSKLYFANIALQLLDSLVTRDITTQIRIIKGKTIGIAR